MTLSPGAQVGEYIVLRFIGAGGFGEVFEAREKSTQHRVALKLLLNAGAGTDPEKFKREALYANRVRERSKFVPTVVAAGIDANTKRPWLAVDFIDGQALEAMMEQRQRSGQRFSWGEAKEILFCVMDALRAAHANNIVHCDIKPANIIVASRSYAVSHPAENRRDLAEARTAGLQTCLISSYHDTRRTMRAHSRRRNARMDSATWARIAWRRRTCERSTAQHCFSPR